MISNSHSNDSKNREEIVEYEYIIAMGISTGGPKLLNQLLTHLEAELPATYVIVQHMPPGFTKPLADRLNTISKLHVKEAENGEKLKKGVVYVAPGGKQLQVTSKSCPQITLTDDEPYKGHRPSVNVLFNSLAALSLNKRTIAVIMTGMGSDGLEGVTNLKRTQKCTVIAQNQESSTVYGMPKAVINAGLQDYIASADEIHQIIKKIVGDNHGR
ncbi:MAG: CheB methylesterase [Clostridia bacterium]|jgi:two-component system chemotaxis response regulator CheB|nr:CheB methylesterase [Clostridia bacterium]